MSEIFVTELASKIRRKKKWFLLLKRSGLCIKLLQPVSFSSKTLPTLKVDSLAIKVVFTG